MEVCITKPDRIFFKEDAEELLLPTSTGYVGILKEHAPLFSRYTTVTITVSPSLLFSTLDTRTGLCLRRLIIFLATPRP